MRRNARLERLCSIILIRNWVVVLNNDDLNLRTHTRWLSEGLDSERWARSRSKVSMRESELLKRLVWKTFKKKNSTGGQNVSSGRYRCVFSSPNGLLFIVRDVREDGWRIKILKFYFSILKSIIWGKKLFALNFAVFFQSRFQRALCRQSKNVIDKVLVVKANGIWRFSHKMNRFFYHYVLKTAKVALVWM